MDVAKLGGGGHCAGQRGTLDTRGPLTYGGTVEVAKRRDLRRAVEAPEEPATLVGEGPLPEAGQPLWRWAMAPPGETTTCGPTVA